MWTVFAERFSDADFAGTIPTIYQPFTPVNDVLLKAIRTWFVVYNSPAFTSISMKIFDDRAGAPAGLRNTFEKTWALADFQTAGYGLKELWFDFANPIKLKGGTTYHAAPWISGSAFSDTSMVSWVKGFPDPNLTTATVVKTIAVPTLPFYLALIGAEP